MSVPAFFARVSSLSMLAGVLLLGAQGGCSSDSTGEGTSGGGGSSSACAQDTRKDVYTAGLAKTSAALTVKILEATPSPPKKGTNTMLLQIADAAGNPMDGATVSVTPYMPDHAHGSAVTPVVTPMGEGKYAVAKIYYPMPGLWQVTVTVQMPNSAPQEVAYNFCFDG